MLDKQKKSKGATNNIQININLKVQSKSSNLVGKKIANSKDINQTHKDLGRSNISTETLNKKKHSMRDNYCKSKRSVQEFINQHIVSYQNQSDEDCSEKKTIQKPVMARNQPLRESTRKAEKRMKSKSLENLKVKYYEKSFEKSRESYSKSKQKSVNKKKNESPKSFIRTGMQQKSHSKDHSRSKSQSKSKSKSRSKSKSKSPLQFSKKKNLQIFKIQQTLTSKEKQRDKSRDKKTERSKQKNGLTAKKLSHDLNSKDRNKTGVKNINKKYSAKIKNQLGKKSTSSDKIMVKKTQIEKKHSAKIHQETKQLRQGKKTQPKKSSNKYIYHETYLNKMVIKIQSLCRGFMARKNFQRELNEQSNRISGLKFRMLKPLQISQNQSSNSIIYIESLSHNSAKSIPSRPEQNNQGEMMQQAPLNPLLLQQLEKLRRKIQEQQGRFKILEQENSELKANLSKIAKEPSFQMRQEKRQLVQIEDSYKISNLRIDSEENLSANFNKANQRSKILELPIAIKTEESNNELEYVDLKKKVQMYQCSPKNGDMNFKFNKNIIKKIFLKEEEKLNEKYFKKNKEYEYMLENEMVSPKTSNIRKQQLQRKIDSEKKQVMIRYKEAQKAMLCVAELQQNLQFEKLQQAYHKKQNQNSNNNSANNSKNSSPSKKCLNLYINVDEIDLDTEKYHPILANHPHRQSQFESSKQEEDLSLLYKKAMNDKIEGKKSDQYLHEIQYEHEPNVLKNSPEVQIHEHEEQRSASKIEESQKHPTSKGFETNLRYIRIFYIKFCEFFRQIPVFKQQILGNLSDEMTFDLQLFLKSYRASMDHRNERELIFPYFKLLATYNLAIPVHILNSFYEEQSNPDSSLFTKSCLDLKQLSKIEYEMYGYSYYELKQYHDLALIDAFNEALNFQRPGGSQASNFDFLTQDFHTVYKNKVKGKFEVDFEERIKEQNFDIILGNSIGRVINNWAFNLCGFLNDSQDPEQQVDEQKLEQIRQIRLTLMLEKTLVQEEINMVNMAPFKFYVRFDLELNIFDILIQQMVNEIAGKSSRKPFSLAYLE